MIENSSEINLVLWLTFPEKRAIIIIIHNMHYAYLISPQQPHTTTHAVTRVTLILPTFHNSCTICWASLPYSSFIMFSLIDPLIFPLSFSSEKPIILFFLVVLLQTKATTQIRRDSTHVIFHHLDVCFKKEKS